jgi:hypothetical protein
LRSVHDLQRECHPDLTILVGELDEKSHFATVKSHNKYSLVSEKNALLTVIEGRENLQSSYILEMCFLTCHLKSMT